LIHTHTKSLILSRQPLQGENVQKRKEKMELSLLAKIYRLEFFFVFLGYSRHQ